MTTRAVGFAHTGTISREIITTHARSIIPIGAPVAIGAVLMGLLAALYARGLASFGGEQLRAAAISPETTSLATVMIMTPIVAIAIIVTLIWAGLAVRLATAAAHRRRVSTASATLVALKRSWRVFVMVLAITGAFLGLAIATPVLMVLGAIGLIAAARGVETVGERPLPSRSTLVAMLVPFGAAVLVLVRWSLAPASIWLSDAGFGAALSDSRARVRGRAFFVGASLLVAALITYGVTEGIVALVALGGWGAYPEFVARVVALVVIGPLLFVATAVHYRAGGAANGLASPPAAPAVSPRASRLARTAVAVTIAMVIPFVVSSNPVPANAALAPAVGAAPSRVFVEVVPASPVLVGAPTEIRITVDAPASEGEFSEEGPVQPTGEITITIDGVAQPGPFVLGGDGIFTPVVINRTFAAGTHEIVASYPGDDTYAGSSDSLTISAGYATSLALIPDASPAVYGAANTLTATVTSATGTPSGTVDFYAQNGVELIGSAALSGGTATLDLSSLLPGDYLLAAQYQGGPNHLPQYTDSVALHIDPALTTTTFTIDPASPSAAGATLTASVVVAAASSLRAPTGSVGVYLNGEGSALGSATLVDGHADVTFSLSPGTNQAVAVLYSAGPGFIDSENDVSHSVLPFTTGVSLNSSTSTTVFGQNLQLTAEVTGGATATGPVSFTATAAGSTPIDLGSATLDGNAVAILDVATLPVGDYEIVASYGGDGATAGGASTGLAHTVDKATVTVGVSSSVASPEFGAVPTLTMTVAAVAPGAGTPSGTITVSRDGTLLDTVTLNLSGVATLDVAVGDAGDHTFTVAYAGDDSFTANSGSLEMTVRQLQTAIYLPGPYDRLDTYGDEQTYAGTVIGNPRTGGSIPSGTVQLWVHGYLVGEGELTPTGAYSITTDRSPVGPPSLLAAWVVYLGDTNFKPSDSRAWSDPTTAVIDQANVPPVITSDPAADALGIGNPVTLFATMPHLGDGATGTVDFYANGIKVGSGTITDDVASFVYTVTTETTEITAEYLGDTNFAASSAVPYPFVADRNAVVIDLAGPGSFEYGQIVDLEATITIGAGVTPAYGVTFRTTSNVVLGTAPVVAGVATLTVCAGDAAGCPDGAVLLGAGATGIVAVYGESATNLPGLSNTIDYSLAAAPTSTSLVLSTSTVQPGGAIAFTATVSAIASGAVPTGTVTFYGSTPLAGGGRGIAFIGSAPLIDGVATLTPVVGDGPEQLSWPADAVRADYFAAGASFVVSSDSQPVTVSRIPVVPTFGAITPTLYGATAVTVFLTRAPGYFGAFRGEVTITTSTGSTCSQWVATGETSVSCNVAWSSVGAQSITATYSGDVLHAEGTSSEPVTVGKGISVLGATAPSQPIAGVDTTVTWRLPGAGATGAVTVYGAGALWCDNVPVTDLSCTGQIRTEAVTGDPVDISVQYFGDDNWSYTDETITVRPLRCAALDVRSTDTRLGTVTVNTAPNCGADGYLTGTTVSVTATPISPSEFVHWRQYTTASPDLVAGSTSLTTTFLVTTDTSTWVRVAYFRTSCFPVSASVTGSGTISVTPASNCTLDSGAAGYLYGTAVRISPVPLVNPTYGEADLFYAFGAQPAGVTVTQDTRGRPFATAKVTSATVVPLTFGPRCRTVTVDFDPATEGDLGTVLTPENCNSPLGSGFVRGTYVTVSATPGLDNYLLVGWSVNGVAVPELGVESEPRVYVDASDVVMTANLVGCFTVDVVINGAKDERSWEVGKVEIDGVANCPDGSDRYLAGTAVTLTPFIRVEGAAFSGWDTNTDTSNMSVGESETGTGLVLDAAREVIIEDDTRVIANFFLDTVCSRLTITGETELLSIEKAGCAAGFYYDAQKQNAIRMGMDPRDVWQQNLRTELRVTIADDEPMGVYASIRGDVRGCFGTMPSGTGASTNLDWKVFGPLSAGVNECAVGGDIDIRVETCQAIVASPELHVVGDDRVFGRDSLPDSFLLLTPDGQVGRLGVDEFGWIQSTGVQISGDSISAEGMRFGPCRDAGNAYPAGTDLAVYALEPTSGFTFDGWANVFTDSIIAAVAVEDPSIVLPDLLTVNPLLGQADGLSPTIPVTAAYTVTCHTLRMGMGITVTSGTLCPGSRPGENRFVAGTLVEVKAPQTFDDRPNLGYTDGAIPSLISRDESTADLVGYVLMDGDKRVMVDYPDADERFARGVVQGLKISAGVFAAASTVAVGLLFPPMGLFFSVMAAGAGISSLLGDDGAASVFEIMNPASITTCASRWAFDNTGDSTGAYNPGAIASVGKTGYDILQGKDVITKPVSNLSSVPLIGSRLPESLKNIPGGLSFGLAAAGFGFALYNAGIADAATDLQTIDQLRGTATMTGCLDEKWRFADSNTSGN